MYRAYASSLRRVLGSAESGYRGNIKVAAHQKCQCGIGRGQRPKAVHGHAKSQNCALDLVY